MKLTRRQILAGLAATASCPALAQWNESDVIRSETDPFARRDPYGRKTDPLFEGRREERGRFSEEDEISRGKAGYPKVIEKWGGRHPSRRLQEALAAFVDDFIPAAMRGHLPWETTLVSNEDVNACALPGGKMVFNTGLVALCDHPGEFAATVAHEIGHIDNEHFRRSDQLKAAAAIAAAQGKAVNIPANLMSDEAPPGVVIDYFLLCILGYGREEEFEADAHVLFIFERLGIDPVYAIRDAENFLRISKLNGHHPLTTPLSTHPSAAERLEVLKGKAAFAQWKVRDFPYRGWDVLKAAFPTPPEWKRA